MISEYRQRFTDRAGRQRTFHFTTTEHPVWKYMCLHQYTHTCLFPMTHVDQPRIIQAQGRYEMHSGLGLVKLLSGYTWNGSNVVVDKDTCMLASAIHDAQCQAMADGLCHGNWSNWHKAAAEYRANCIIAGMPRWRAYTRFLGILIGGGNGYKWIGSIKKTEKV